MDENTKNKNSKQEETKTVNEIPETLSANEAINILIQAAEIGQKKGIYTFKESALIYKAIETFVQK